MASRIAQAAKGIRFSSTQSAESAAWLAERAAIKEHAGPAAETWRKISIYVCIPALIASTANAYNLFAKHQEHLEHERHEGHEKVKYPYMRIRSKAFPWGDETLFYNPDINL
ncbi:Cytochrome c oxidase subunit 6A, mitochondrial [Lunasporangiospora selenospora]|uniref:Cytochrome c oxidase subunit 13, mitochondrial n=1 Tax=Lunasporangiospora selenospora TaxID=979761 RepID=A0A9P6KD54_9FUNG|nr:Cytochrome c oxidase subunit 6A, mitochondrial [Lunasporangiospora selenospora]